MIAPPDWLVAELPTDALLRRVLVWQPVGLLLMVCHVLLVRQSIWMTRWCRASWDGCISTRRWPEA